jgi:copper chaperone NosL
MTALIRGLVSSTSACVAVLTLVACVGTPPPIEYGIQGCDYCRMEITDSRYGAQLVTTRGKVYAFDSIECLASFAETLPEDRIRSILVTDFSRPGTMIPVENARFYRDERRGGPMGAGLLAVAHDADSTWVAINVRGMPLTWSAIREMAASGTFHDRVDDIAGEG